jgi:hypothetical protein
MTSENNIKMKEKAIVERELSQLMEKTLSLENELDSLLANN